MSPRIKTIRKVLNPPIIKGFKPYGQRNKEIATTSVSLLYEEYEALRLCDYDMYNHIQASSAMGVSRPTFTRIYGSARQKIALAFVEGRHIIIEGGKVYFDSDWYHCSGCSCFFNNPERDIKITSCPLCKSTNIDNYEHEIESKPEHNKSCNDMCICVQCGYEQIHKQGNPCAQEVCPECNSRMSRKSQRCKH